MGSRNPFEEEGDLQKVNNGNGAMEDFGEGSGGM